MQAVKRLALGALALVLALAAVLVVRTLTFGPSAAAFADVRLAPAPPFDLETAARHLSEAIRIRTMSVQEGGEPDRREWQRLLDWVATTYPLSAQAMSRELVAGYTPIYTWQGADASLAPIILMAHQDVVPVDPATEASWRHPPFDGVIADGAVWGRGAIDDKSSLVAIFEATEALAASGFKPRRTVIVVNGHDEEVGQKGAMAAAQALKTRGVMAEFVLDEGLLTLADFPLLNAPAALVGVAEKGYATLAITAKSEGGHSSMPPRQTAVRLLADALVAITSDPDPMRLDGPGGATVRAVGPHADFLPRMVIANEWLFGPLLIREVARTPAGAAALHTTMAPTMLEGSPKENVLPQAARAAINYRILPGQSSADVMARAKAAVGDIPVELAWSGEVKEPSPVSSTTSQAWNTIAALASRDGALPVAPGIVLASTDSAHMAPVAKDVYRFQPLTLSLEETKMVHGTDEHLTLDNLRGMIEFYARLIATTAG